MFSKVLIANRGAISVRIQRTLRRLGIRSVAVYSKADAGSLHVQHADEAVCLGEAQAADTYLDIDKVIAAARDTGCDAIHPGYGFLSENLEFARACEEAGIVFVGPTAEQIRDFGLKHTARSLAEQSGVPLLPGTGLLEDEKDAVGKASEIGYPVMLKSTAGGGGIGMQRCFDEAQLRDAFASVKRLSRNNFSNDGLFLEKFVRRARHVEVQIFGDGAGQVVALGERDCSPQRRHQKVVEETPAPGMSDETRQAMQRTAVALGRTVNYRNAGTVEFIYDPDEGAFYFLEVNTRLQVEHGVTEAVTGVDLVEWMLRAAAGETGFLGEYRHEPRGHAIQVRVYAEDPARDFRPVAGLVTDAVWPECWRCDSWVETGVEVSPYYDPLLAKVIVCGAERAAAIEAMDQALAGTALAGVETNLDYLRQVIADPVFREGRQTTAWLNEFRWRPRGIEVVEPGTQTTVQDWPGRTGYWHIGVPPSGPFDDLAFRLGNRLLGNDEQAAGLEMTMTGATLRFREPTRIALTGADMQPTLDGEPVPLWQVIRVPAGSELQLGVVAGSGSRSYLCVAGGLVMPEYLGSRSTFTLGGFGGHGGRALWPGDVLHLDTTIPSDTVTSLPAELIPDYPQTWTLRVIYGPHGAPDFFTPGDMEMFFATDWEVHYNSSRTGVRLIGPKPDWARPDGGEAGLHPSNIHDNAYAVGAVDFTGDMPVILGPDGPSLGGFVCPVTIIKADLWKLGQLKAGERIRFKPVGYEQAEELERSQRSLINSLQGQLADAAAIQLPEETVLARLEAGDVPLDVVYRPGGDDNILIEYGPHTLDLALRFRVQALLERLEKEKIPAVRDLTPGIRSLQVHFDNLQLSQPKMLALLQEIERDLPGIDDMAVTSRIVHLPLSWNDPQCQKAVDKYMQSVRADAPWCPDNLEFIRRINGLDSVDDVKRIVFDASYLVMGLGDVYLGAPVATPLDPRHRLVTTKYNPARTWTPENAVGIGGAYLCVYGMEGPGGYQFVGRTVQVWNKWKQTREFEPGKPWLLRFFDQLRFFEVSHEELMTLREDFPRGNYHLRMEEEVFRLKDYQRFLDENADSISEFQQHQQQAFAGERERWRRAGQDLVAEQAPEPEAAEEVQLAEGESLVSAQVPGSVWQLKVAEGDSVEEGDVVAVVESMKMEVPVTAPAAGTIGKVLCSEGAAVKPGQGLAVLRE
jgi:urea carboxylase